MGLFTRKGIQVSVFDPEANATEVESKFGIQLLKDPSDNALYDAIVVAVRHKVFETELRLQELRSLAAPGSPILIDVKSMYSAETACSEGFVYWRL